MTSTSKTAFAEFLLFTHLRNHFPQEILNRSFFTNERYYNEVIKFFLILLRSILLNAISASLVLKMLTQFQDRPAVIPL